MAASTPERVSSTPPLTQPAAPSKGRPRKPSAKVLEVQRSLRTRSSASRSIQNKPSTSTTATAASEREGRETNLEEVVSLITNLKETITQQISIIASQNSVIDGFRADLAEIKSEQQSLKNQNAKLQEEIRSLQAQLNAFSASLPSTRSWASVAASRSATDLGTSLPQATNTEKPNREPSYQLVVDVSRVNGKVAEKVSTTEVAKQTITQGIKDIDRLMGATVKNFRIWHKDNSTKVIKFSVEKEKEAAFRQTATQWLESRIPGARLIGPKWHAIKADWIEVPLAMDTESGKVSKAAMKRFGKENGVEVCTMRWLGRPRPSGQHASVVIKVATKEDAMKLLGSDSVSFGGGGVIVSPFEE
ncbi:MAG: hypothetical protein M1840_000711 [Geoglossum simile]|nr:MAG: hypothetical protein M1840_000711 [Geoglossum simile]